MKRLDQVVLASGNAGKLKEFAALLAPLGIRMVSQADLGVKEVAEPHLTFMENALLKARHASKCTGLPALADDSGLCVSALDGAPGVHSARFAEAEHGSRSDEANNLKLVRLLNGQDDRRAMYVAVLVLVRRHDDPLPLFAQGLWHGQIVDSPRGLNGFGYDPHFFLPDQGMTAAELSPYAKNALSHRAKAMAQLVDALRSIDSLERIS